MTFTIISATLFSEEGSHASESDTTHPSLDHEADEEASRHEAPYPRCCYWGSRPPNTALEALCSTKIMEPESSSIGKHTR